MTAEQKPKIEEMSFETALGELEQIVGRLESGQGGLEDSIKIYERGVALRQHCEAKLKNAESRIEKITIGQDGQVKAEPLDP
jgi:exodeoxyribonuclease VII small subunit